MSQTTALPCPFASQHKAAQDLANLASALDHSASLILAEKQRQLALLAGLPCPPAEDVQGPLAKALGLDLARAAVIQARESLTAHVEALTLLLGETVAQREAALRMAELLPAGAEAGEEEEVIDARPTPSVAAPSGLNTCQECKALFSTAPVEGRCSLCARTHAQQPEAREEAVSVAANPPATPVLPVEDLLPLATLPADTGKRVNDTLAECAAVLPTTLFPIDAEKALDGVNTSAKAEAGKEADKPQPKTRRRGSRRKQTGGAR